MCGNTNKVRTVISGTREQRQHKKAQVRKVCLSACAAKAVSRLKCCRLPENFVISSHLLAAGETLNLIHKRSRRRAQSRGSVRGGRKHGDRFSLCGLSRHLTSACAPGAATSLAWRQASECGRWSEGEKVNRWKNKA